MSLFAHHAGSSLAARDVPFDLVHARYVAMPALLWLAAIAVVLLATALQAPPSQLSRAPTGDGSHEVESWAHGA